MKRPSRSKRDDAGTSPPCEPLALRDIYVKACNKLGVRPNSNMLRQLPDQVGVPYPDPTLDVRGNYLGNNGTIALMEVIEKITQLKELLISHNGLRNSAIQAIGSVASHHPSLTYIDISDNFISEGAAASLESMLRTNPRITTVVFENTKIGVEQRVRIVDLLEANREHCAMLADNQSSSPLTAGDGKAVAEMLANKCS